MKGKKEAKIYEAYRRQKEKQERQKERTEK